VLHTESLFGVSELVSRLFFSWF